ncbi:hypothetical protein PCE1_000746 [Barthelona sp. PCE]
MSLQLLHRFTVQPKPTCMAFSSLQPNIFVVGYENGSVTSFEIMRDGSTRAYRTYKGHKSSISSICVAKDVNTFAAGSVGGSIRIWDLNSGESLGSLRGHGQTVTGLGFFSDALFLVSCGHDAKVRVHDLSRMGTIMQVEFEGFPTWTSFSPHGRWIVCANDEGLIRIWDLQDSKSPVASFNDFNNAVTDIIFHDSDCYMVAVSEDRNCIFYNLETFEKLAVCEPNMGPIHKCFLDATSGYLVTVTGNCIRSYTSPGAGLAGHMPAGWNQAPLAISPAPLGMDGSMVFACINRSTIELYVGDAPTDVQSRSQNTGAQSPKRIRTPVHEPKPHHIEAVPIRPEVSMVTPTQQPTHAPGKTIIGVSDTPIGISPSAFLATNTPIMQTVPNERAVMRQVSEDSTSMLTVLSTRLTHLRTAAALWQKNQAKCISTLAHNRDESVLADFIKHVILGKNLSLKIAALVLPHISPLLNSKYEAFVSAGLTLIGDVCDAFRGVIRTSLAVKPTGVDISHEERYNRCQRVVECLINFRKILQTLSSRESNIGASAADVMSRIDECVR